MMTWNLLNFFDGNSPVMEQLIFFHDHTLMILFIITIFIFYLMTNLIFNNFICLSINEGQEIEIIWTILPMLILIFIAIPSMRILYLMEENFNPLISLKIIGHQWYWSYDYANFNKNFDSFLIPENDLLNLNFRLIETDNHIIFPFNMNIRLLLTSTDVIHAWTIPALGVKMDAIPGRLNQMNFLAKRLGIFFGQCSEICGTNHSFMPIMMEVTTLKKFFQWIKK